MGPKESCLQSLGICRKLFDIIMKSLATQTDKTVTLGVPAHGTLPGIHPQNCPDPSFKQGESPTQQCTDKVETEKSRELENSVPGTEFISAGEDHKREVAKSFQPCVDGGGTGEGEEAEPGESKGLKKAVSFHDEVEKIEPAKKKTKMRMKRNRLAEKVSMMEQDNEHLPLKSILKMSSDLDSTSSPITQ